MEAQPDNRNIYSDLPLLRRKRLREGVAPSEPPGNELVASRMCVRNETSLVPRLCLPAAKPQLDDSGSGGAATTVCYEAEPRNEGVNTAG